MDLSQLIANYRTPETAKLLARTTKIALLVGISGAGKDTIKRQLLKSGEFHDLVSHTTRQPRSNNGVLEQDNIDYHFVSDAEMAKLVIDQAFIEVKHVHTTAYGTSIAELKKAHDEGKIAITDLDVQGADEYKHLAHEVVAIFILPPDYATWVERLRHRYASEEEFTAEWPKRRESAIRELTHALEVPYYHVVVNEDLDMAVRIVSEIAHKPDTFHRKDDEARLHARDLLEQIEAS